MMAPAVTSMRPAMMMLVIVVAAVVVAVVMMLNNPSRWIDLLTMLALAMTGALLGLSLLPE